MTDFETIRRIRKSLRLFERELDRFKGEQCCSGVTFKQCHTLLAIEDEKNTNIGDLSKVLNLDKSTTSRTVDSLVNLDLISRVIPKDNRRCTIISLTTKGKKLCDSINEINDDFFKTLFNEFPAEEVSTFIKVLDKLSQKMLQTKRSCESG